MLCGKAIVWVLRNKIQLDGDYSNPRATPVVEFKREGSRKERRTHDNALNKMAHLNRRLPRNQNIF